MTLVIMGWKLGAKKAKMRKPMGSLLKMYQPPIHFTTIYRKPPCARVLGDEGIKGEVTFPSCTSRPGNLVPFTAGWNSEQPILQTQGAEDPEKIDNLPKVTKLVSSRTRN